MCVWVVCVVDVWDGCGMLLRLVVVCCGGGEGGVEHAANEWSALVCVEWSTRGCSRVVE